MKREMFASGPEVHVWSELHSVNRLVDKADWSFVTLRWRSPWLMMGMDMRDV